MEKNKLIYIACPYSHRKEDVMKLRVHIATAYTAHIIKQGYVGAFSPITYSHALKEVDEFPNTWEFWESIDTIYLQNSEKLIVLTLDGWKESQGVGAEIDIAKEMRIPIEYVNPLTDEIDGLTI